MTSLFSAPPKPQQQDYAAQAAAQQAAREADKATQLAADRAEAVASADEAKGAEAARLKRLKAQTAGSTTGTGQLGGNAQVEAAGLKSKLG